MKILLDTCTFLWISRDAPELSAAARKVFRDPDNEAFLSAVSVWELGVKYALGKLPLPEAPDVFVAKFRERHGLASLPFTEDAALRVHKLPDVHRDPFDRMLVSQALAEGMVLLTPDPQIAAYPVQTLW